MPVQVDAAAVAEALAAYVRVDTRPGAEVAAAQPVDPAAEATPAWQAHLLELAAPLGLRSARLGDALALFVDTPDPRPPVLWLSHADVVPVDDETGWTHAPFAGVIADGFVWGRGTLDNKASTVCQLEALKALAAAGLAPSRDLVLLVTSDEETGGTQAAFAAQHLDQLGGPEVVLDEGSFVLPDFVPGVQVAMVAVAEKTFVSFDLVAEVDGGHASMPTGASAVDRLVGALDRVQAWETPAALPPPLVAGLRRLGPHVGGAKGVVMGNADLLAPLVLGGVQKTPAGNAVTRDTVAITILAAGVQDNVVPARATATLNARLLPGKTPEAFQQELEAVIADPDVQVTPRGWTANATTSDWETPEFRALEAAILHVYPEAVPVPSQTPGTMDARYFAAAGLRAYRFHPFVAPDGERRRIHGTDERIAVDDLGRGARFYAALAQEL